MRYFAILGSMVFLIACSTDPKPKAQPPETHDMAQSFDSGLKDQNRFEETDAPKDQDMANVQDMANQRLDMSMDMMNQGGLGDEPHPMWVLRDKDGKKIRSKPYPVAVQANYLTSQALLTGQAQPFGERNNTKCVAFEFIGVKEGNLVPYNLQTGKVDTDCHLQTTPIYFDGVDCTGNKYTVYAPALFAFDGLFWVTGGISNQKLNPANIRSQYNFQGCKEVPDGSALFSETAYPNGVYRWNLLPLSTEYTNRLPNPPYTLAIE